MTRPPDPAGQYPYQPQHYPPPPPAKKKMGKGKVFLLGCLTPLGVLLLLFIIIGIASSGGGKPTPTGVSAGNEASTTAQQPAKPAQPATRTVVYQVAGTAKTASSITYTTDGMTTTNQESDAALPWSKTLTLPAGKALQMVSIVAQGNGAGRVQVTITVDGKVFKEASADGYGVAMANGNIGSMGG